MKQRPVAAHFGLSSLLNWFEARSSSYEKKTEFLTHFLLL
jgi:hypothetical protein